MRLPTAWIALALVPAVAHAGFQVSSYKKVSRNAESSPYGAQAAIDGDPTTAWIIDSEKSNKGEWIEIDVPVGKVDKVSAFIGWGKDDMAWADYSRVKSVKVEVFDLAGGGSKVAWSGIHTFEDKRETQIIEVPDVAVGDEYMGGRVRLTIDEVYDGVDFAHFAMAEVLVHMAEFDAATVKLSGEGPASADGHGGDLLIDGSAKTFWAAPAGGEASVVVSGGRYSVSSIGITAGPSSHGRPKVVEVIQSDVTRRYELADKPGAVQWFSLPALVGYTGSGDGPVTVKVVEVYPGSTTPAAAIAEIAFKATYLEAF